MTEVLERAGPVPPGGSEVLVELQDLVVDYGTVRAVDHVSLQIRAGEIVGLAGESGCGKSTTGNAIMQILRPPAQVTSGRILFRGDDLTGKSTEELRQFRWRNVSMVFQSAMNALNPVMRVGEQFVDMMRAHERIDRGTALARSGELLERVGIDRRRVRSARRRGLLTSSMPASTSTSPSTVKASAAPGKKNGHHSPCSTVEFVCAQYSVTPQLVTDWSPRPRNSRPASVRSAM